MKRLIKDEILLDLVFSDFDTCLDCIKGKLTAKIRNAKALTDAPRLLGLFIQIFVSHSILLLWLAINISSCSWMIIPVMVLSNSFLRSLTLLRLSKLKLSFNSRKKIKVVHYDSDGEYYGKYDETSNLGPFCSIYND